MECKSCGKVEGLDGSFYKLICQECLDKLLNKSNNPYADCYKFPCEKTTVQGCKNCKDYIPHDVWLANEFREKQFQINPPQ